MYFVILLLLGLGLCYELLYEYIMYFIILLLLGLGLVCCCVALL